MYLGWHIDVRNIAKGIGELIDWIVSTEFWTAHVEPHPVRALLVVISATGAMVLALVLWSKRNQKIVDNSKQAKTAQHTAAYYRNKLKAPDAHLQTRDKKQFKRCDPLPDGLVPKAALEQVVWNWSYCRYVASLIDRDAIATERACGHAKRPVRRAVRKAFMEAEAAVPDKCRVWLEYVDRKGRPRDKYRFTYGIDEILAAVPEPVAKAARLLEQQKFKCAKCGKDPDDGVLFELSPDGAHAWCDECAIGDRAAEAIRGAMEKQDPFVQEA